MEPYRNSIKKISSGDAYDDIVDTEVKQGFVRRLDLVTCENAGHAYTELRIGILRAGAEYWIEGEKSPSAATLYWMNDPVILAEDEQLVVRFTGCTDGDELNVTIRGITQPIFPMLDPDHGTTKDQARAVPEATPPLPSIQKELEKIPSLPVAEGKAPRKRYIWEVRKLTQEEIPGA